MMSLYGVMRTSTSGMNAQSSRISSVAENVANSNTTGYKAVRTEFASLFIENNIATYNSGSVDVAVRRLNSNQGVLTPTNSATDLAIKGDGFFVVNDSNDATFLTRAGSFVPNASGDYVNTGGYKLLGYPLAPNSPTVVVNGYNGLKPVNIGGLALTATPTTRGQFQANLPSVSPVVPTGSLPSANLAAAEYSAKSSIVAYGNLGEQVLIDTYFTKSSNGVWEVAAFDHAAAGPNGGFPYASGPLSTTTISFNASDGKLSGSSSKNLVIPVPGGRNFDLNFANMSQLDSNFSVITAEVNGNVASAVDIVEISKDGIVYISHDNGQRQAVFQIPLAKVASPDNLQTLSGNVFTPTSASGNVQLGFPGKTDLGSINSGVLEQSTVDIASEFTDMIDAQRGYTANSKVFQTGAELMDVLVNLKR
jgi:flagellar hook protein FlgE